MGKTAAALPKGTAKAEVTVYLSLVFILLLSFVAAMIESASIQNAKNYRRADVNRALECVFAEYQKELLEDFDIFALEGSYETGQYTEGQVLDRISFYSGGNMEHKVKRIQYLTDNGCEAFYQQVCAYMQHKYGVTALEDKLGSAPIWEQQKEKGEALEKEERESKGQLDEMLKENEAELPSEDNPISYVDTLKQTPILELVMPKDRQVSEKALKSGDILTQRTLNRGYGDFSEEAKTTGAITKLLFGEYVMEHFADATKEKKGGALDYEMEYILAGKDSDKENLEAVVNKLMIIRFLPNYTYIQTDGEMKAEAEVLAATLCTLAAVPAISSAVAQGILLAWAFGETIVDIRSLLSGNKVSLVKSKESWQLQLSSLLTLGTKEDGTEGMDNESGLDYKEYLRMLLFLEKKELLGTRCLSLIEQILKQEKGLSFFKADQCISRIETATTCPLRRGITYRFDTYFGYN